MINMRKIYCKLKQATILSGALLCLFGSFAPTVAHAIDLNYYAGNEVLYYNPDAPSCSTDTTTATAPLTGDDNAQKIFNYLVGKGLNAAQAAGFLGNIEAESGFNPNMQEPVTIVPKNTMPTDGRGFGLIQWSYTPRQAPLVQLAKDTGRDTTDLSLQLDYMWKELTDPALAANNPWVNTIKDIKAVNDPVDAARIVHYDYERSAVWPGFPAIRGTNAQQWYDKFKSLAPASQSPGSTTGVSTCAGNPTTGGTGNGGIGDYTSDKFKIFNQCNAPWGTLSVPSPDGTACQVACGPTSMAMIIVNMTGKDITPTDTINYTTSQSLWYGIGGTTMDANKIIAEHWGLKANVVPASTSIEDIRAILSKGGLVMMAGFGATPYLNFVNHYVVIRGITTSGQFIVADPNGHSGNYDANTMIASIRNAGLGGVAVYK